MGQAVEVVQEAADAVTGTVHDEGAATELDRWFPAEAPGPASTQGRPGHGS
jgi:hydroxymethylpyrimidine pyrophosphatase-like HAD family hydrolase